MQDKRAWFVYWSLKLGQFYPISALKFCVRHCHLTYNDYVTASVEANETPVALFDRKARTIRLLFNGRQVAMVSDLFDLPCSASGSKSRSWGCIELLRQTMLRRADPPVVLSVTRQKVHEARCTLCRAGPPS